MIRIDSIHSCLREAQRISIELGRGNEYSTREYRKEGRICLQCKFRKVLLASLFGAIRLPGAWIRSRGRRFTCGGVLLLAGDCPPATLVLRQLAHLRAMFHAGLVRAVAVAQRRRTPRPMRRSLICESSSRNRPQQDCRANCLTESTTSRLHEFSLRQVSTKTDSA
jgi:hypothetical protein